MGTLTETTTTPVPSVAPPAPAATQDTLTLRGHLDLDKPERAALFATLGAFRAAVAHCEAAGRDLGTTANALLHQRCYGELRRASGLPANLVIRAIAVAARRLKESSLSPPELEYDSRVARLRAGYRLDLATLTGRLPGVPLILTNDVEVPFAAAADLIRLAVSPDAEGIFQAHLTVRHASPNHSAGSRA